MEKDDDLEGDEDDNSPEKRDLAKARKFKRMSDAGAIPEHMYEILLKAKTRSSRTILINELFEKNDRGKVDSEFRQTRVRDHQIC